MFSFSLLQISANYLPQSTMLELFSCFLDSIVNLVAQNIQVLDFKVALEICPGFRGSPW